MITALSISNLNNQHISKQFVRCKEFMLVDSAKKTYNSIPNPYFNEVEDAGRKAVKFLAALGVSKIVAGDFGGHVQDEAHNYKIQLVMVDISKIKLKQFINF